MRYHTGHGQRSLASWLAWVWLLLIVYASLYPFTGWRLPAAGGWVVWLHLPWTRWIPGFDPASNLLGYLPLGFLLCQAGLSGSVPSWRAAIVSVMAALALSFGMEVTQQFVPGRVPSAQDWLMNTCGAVLGATLAWTIDRLGWTARWRWTLDRWLEQGGSGAATLLLLWPVALLFPSPLPFGLGQIGGRLRDVALGWFDGVPWAEPMTQWLESAEVSEPASVGVELTVAVLGLLAPCLLAFVASASVWRRACLVLGALAMATCAMTLSTVLNFGPEHALAWRTPAVTTAMLIVTAMSTLLIWIGPRVVNGLALVALTGLVVLVHLAPSDPYFAQSLQAWEQGTFIRFHGLAQWVGWLWPYAVIAWLLARAGQAR